MIERAKTLGWGISTMSGKATERFICHSSTISNAGKGKSSFNKTLPIVDSQKMDIDRFVSSSDFVNDKEKEQIWTGKCSSKSNGTVKASGIRSASHKENNRTWKTGSKVKFFALFTEASERNT